jgi:hypothetical protein
MDYIIKNKNNKHFIILVLGLNGGGYSIWRGSSEKFVETPYLYEGKDLNTRI